MKQKIIIISFLIISASEAKTQSTIGLGFGYSNNHLNTNISNRTFTKNKNGSGFGSELIFSHSYSRKINFETGITFLQKNYSFNRTGSYTGISEDFKNSYLQLPLIVQFKFFDKQKIQLFFDAGFFFSYWASAKVNGITPDILNSSDNLENNGRVTQYLQLTRYAEKYQFNKIRDSRLEMGWLGGITTSYYFNKKYALFISGKFYQSFDDQQKQYMINQVPKFNQTVFISMGCLLNLSANPQ